MEELQSGFRKERGVQDHIFTVKQITEKSEGSSIFVSFTALGQNKGMDRKLRNSIESIYKRTRNYVRTEKEKSNEFETKIN